MNLIVNAALVEPPTEVMFFREITYLAHHQLSMDCLLEIERSMRDAYYHFLLTQGLLDNIQGIITPQENVAGLRIAHEKVKDPSISIEAITCKNFKEVLGLVQAYADLKNL